LIDAKLATLRRVLFRSPKQDWTDKEAWSKRAILWKMTAMAAMSECTDEKLREHHELIMKADQYRAPHDDEMVQVCGWLQGKIIAGQEKSKIEVVKS